MSHRWSFFRAGGFDQVRFDTGADFAALAELDPKLWVALSCPTTGLELSPRTLELLDTDKDGRVRLPEVLAAVKWTVSMLKDPELLVKAPAKLPLDAIADPNVLASAKKILSDLNRPDDDALAPAETADTVKIIARTRLNGDGVLPPESAGDDAHAAAAIKEVMAVFGPSQDLSGLQGADAKSIDRFFTEAKSLVDWWKRSQGDAKVLPLADATLPAWEALEAVRGKIDDFFARCALAAMVEPKLSHALNPPEAEWLALAREQLSGTHDRLASLPLALVKPGATLSLSNEVNPAWTARMQKFCSACVVPLGGKATELTFDGWLSLKERLAPHGDWLATRPKTSVDKLGLPRLKELAEGPAFATLQALLAKEKAIEPEVKAITSVDRLAHYVRDLKTLLENFVSFRDFYSRARKATFQAGTLYLDGRSMDLCLEVDDIGKHAALAAQSHAFLAYCECTRTGAEKLNIVAAFTGGDADFLSVGRNGVFFDRHGKDWDAHIVRLVEAPISVRQAFFAPYKRLARFVTEQIEKFAASKDKETDAVLTGGVTGVAGPKPATPFDVAKFAGIFAAIGLALGSLGTALSAAAGGLFSLSWWQMPLAIGAAIVIISTPSMLLAGMKLRLRNLAPLLDACGWAINSRVHINIPFGATLTQLPKLPHGSKRALYDPFAPRRRIWTWLMVLAVIAAIAWWLYTREVLAPWFP